MNIEKSYLWIPIVILPFNVLILKQNKENDKESKRKQEKWVLIKKRFIGFFFLIW
jgi:hypothetical protein